MAQDHSKLAPQVAIIMGSLSDAPTMQEACEVLSDFEIGFCWEVVSAHRTPEKMQSFAKEAKAKRFEVIIAGAGGAAHLPGMVASLTSLPVIGVPIFSSNSMMGLDSLLSIAQMPNGIPVATMNVGGAKNAALLAVRMLGLKDVHLQTKYEVYQQSLMAKVEAQNLELQKKKLS